jgi:hypothetical protein
LIFAARKSGISPLSGRVIKIVPFENGNKNLSGRRLPEVCFEPTRIVRVSYLTGSEIKLNIQSFYSCKDGDLFPLLFIILNLDHW